VIGGGDYHERKIDFVIAQTLEACGQGLQVICQGVETRRTAPVGLDDRPGFAREFADFARQPVDDDRGWSGAGLSD
jgi:hypothetical protein